MSDVTDLLNARARGDAHAASRLLTLVYEELRRLAAQKLAQEKPGQTLQATALVHEAYLRLFESGGKQSWEGRGHFFAACAEAMRRILVESARHKKRLKHGGGRQRAELDDALLAVEAPNNDDVIAVDEALQQLAVEDGQTAELVKLIYFAGLTTEQAAELLGISVRTAYRDWAYARAWLYKRLHGD
jgi:RNA polymerase sigma factor (TIGR02999 family)